jgi:hypothetical protein
VPWVWSTALGLGARAWLNRHSLGKLFLDWSEYARVLLALATLWLVIACALCIVFYAASKPAKQSAKIIGLILLLGVPAVFSVAASPNLHPHQP